MRVAPLLCVLVCLSACGGTSVAPTSVGGGTTMNIAGTWDGTIVSSNNSTAQVRMVLRQTEAVVTGTWDSSSVSWSGEITGAVTGSTFDAQFKFSGTSSNGTVCTGTAVITGPVTAATMTLTSANGVIGGPCPAPLPVGLTIEVRRPTGGSS